MKERVVSPVGRIFVFALGLLLVFQFGFLTQNSNNDVGVNTTSQVDDIPTTRTSDEPDLLQSVDYLSDTVWIPQGDQFYIRYDEASNSLVEMRKPDPTAGMPQAFVDAINRSPNWLKDNITRKFEQLVDTDIDVGANSAPEFADLDGDGDLDLIVGTQIGTLDYFENLDPALHYLEGHDVFVGAVYKRNTSMFMGISVVGRAHPVIADIYSNGLLDLLIGTQSGEVHLFENQGTVSLPVWAPVVVIPGVTADSGFASIDIEDINFDTYPDIILGEANGTLHYYENQMGSFVEIMVGLEWTDVGDNSAPRFADMDDDGDFDLTVGDNLGRLHYFRNDTTNWTYDPLMYEYVDFPANSVPALVDLNLDFIPDLISGENNGRVHYYQNIGSVSQPRWLLYQNTITGFNWANHRQFYSDNSSVYLRERSVPARALEYANYINSVPQKMVDELVFSIAHSAVGTLMHGATWAEVWLNNTETLYYNDAYLEYANIVEYNLGTPDQFSTVEYWVLDEDGCCNASRYEYPPYIYYWWIVHPKGSDELPTYINPIVRTSGHGGASPRPPAGNGTFWRWSVFNMADTSWPDDSALSVKYPIEENPPMLKDHMAGVKYLWNGESYSAPRLYNNSGETARNATGVILRPWSQATHGVEVTSHWVESTLALNAQEHGDGNRPRQIVRIQFEHNGNCGELSDLTLGAMRASLIPYIEVLGIAGDHCWGAFYERGWHQMDNYWSAGGSVIAKWGNYHYGWNRDWGSFITYRGDGAMEAPFPINETHRIYDHNGDGGSDRGNVTVKVTDWNGNPIDGVRVSVADWNYLPPFGLSLGGAWYYTDGDGIAYFTTSESRQRSMGDNNYDEGIMIHLNSRYGGGTWNPRYPNRLIINVPGLNNEPMYYVNFTVDQNKSRPYPLISQGPPPAPGSYSVKVKYETKVGVQHPVNGFGMDDGRPFHDEEIYTGIHLDAFVVNKTEFEKYLKGYLFEGYSIIPNRTQSILTFDIPDPAEDWYFVLSNRDTVETTKLVEIEAVIEDLGLPADMQVLPPGTIDAQLSGPGLAYVTVSWTLSGDDGSGENDVVRYDIYSSTTYIPAGVGYTKIASVPAGVSSYDVPSVGADHLSHFFYVVAVDDCFNEEESPNQMAKVAIPTVLGMQLVSSILNTSGQDMATVFQTVGFGRVWTYDSTDAINPWKSYIPGKPINEFDLTSSVDRGKGYWIDVEQCGLLRVVGTVPITTQITLYQGWNLVSYPSVQTDYSVWYLKNDTGATTVEAADSTVPFYHLKKLSNSDTLVPGFGYWIYVPSETVWTVNF
ncbi:MAG: hypothetical protein E3J35_07465 [Methanomassiliicoccales archaeon]|nr:MAG: hypothetical protein E3J35_07465 [Methanomassiliicoccales archaeon]